MTGRTVAFPTFELLKQVMAMLNSLYGYRSFVGNRNRCARFLIFPARRKRFDKGDEIDAILIRKGSPRRHIGIIKSPANRIKQILIGGKRARWRRAALESSLREIPGFGVEIWCVFTSTVAASPVPDVERAFVLIVISTCLPFGSRDDGLNTRTVSPSAQLTFPAIRWPSIDALNAAAVALWLIGSLNRTDRSADRSTWVVP